MLDQNELNKYFSKSQQQDMIELDITCQNTPRGRIRRARPRKVKPDHIPRPVNSFMSYRTKKQVIIKKLLPTANHRDISKMVAKWWHNISPAEKSIYVDLAKKAKEIHTEKFPDYTFRPKCKPRKPKNANKTGKTDEALNDGLFNGESDTCARTRPYVPSLKSHPVAIPVIHNDIFNFRNVSSSSAATSSSTTSNSSNGNNINMYPSSSTTSSSSNGNNINMYHPTTNNNMYSDEVLFEADERNNNNFWKTSSYNSGEQVMANAFPTISPVQDPHPYYDYPSLSYFPSPLPSVLSHEPIQTVDPNTLINQFMPPTTTATNSGPPDVSASSALLPNNNNLFYNNIGDGYIIPELFSGLSYEITPYSQAMGTPMLCNTPSPASPINNNQLVMSAEAHNNNSVSSAQGTHGISTDFYEAHQEIFSMLKEGCGNTCLNDDGASPIDALPHWSNGTNRSAENKRKVFVGDNNDFWAI